jgi:hypothetical protein
VPIETLRRYLSDEDVELRRVVSVLFKGIVTSAVRADDEEWASLKSDIERIDATIEGEFTTEHLLVAAGAAIRALDPFLPPPGYRIAEDHRHAGGDCHYYRGLHRTFLVRTW